MVNLFPRAGAEPRSPLGLGMLAAGRAAGTRHASYEAPAGSADASCRDCGAQRIDGSSRCLHCERELGGECGW